MSDITKAEKTEQFEKLYKYYQANYPSFNMKDTLFNCDSEFIFPENYNKLENSKMSAYSKWISEFPLWHKSKAVGNWRGRREFLSDEISRVIHLSWRGKSNTDIGITLRLLADFLHLNHTEQKLFIKPAKGEQIDYYTWLKGKPLIDRKKGLYISPDMKRDTSTVEFFKFMNFMIHYLDYKSLIEVCEPISESDIAIGDMLITSDKSGKTGNVYTIMNSLENKSGEKLYIIGTGCKQACDFYIPLFNQDRNNPWIRLSDIKRLSDYSFISGFFRFTALKNMDID